MLFGHYPKLSDQPIGGIARSGTLKEYGVAIFLKTLISPIVDDVVIRRVVETSILMQYTDILLLLEHTTLVK